MKQGLIVDAASWCKAMGWLAERAARLLDAALGSPERSTVHALSTTLRRLLVLDRVMREMWGASPLPKSDRRRLKRFRVPLGQVRDLEEISQKFCTLHLTDPFAVALQAFLYRERAVTQKQFVAAMRGLDRDIFTRLSKQCKSKKTFRDTPGLPALSVLQQNLQRMQDLRAQAIDAGDNLALHRFRVQYKRYRYSMEVLGPYLPGRGVRLAKELKPLQTLLGDAHDWLVLLETARGYGAGHRSEGCALSLLRLQQHSERAHAVARAAADAWIRAQ